MLEIVIYSISENDLVLDTVVSIANFLSAGGLSVVVKEDEKKKGISYRDVKGCSESGVFRLNGVNYYAKDSESEIDNTDVFIWDAGTTNVLYEMRENVNAYMCIDAELEVVSDVINYFDEIGTKTDVLLFNCDKETLQDFKTEGIRCIQTDKPEDGICPHEICERLKNAVVLKGLPLPKASKRSFSPLVFNTSITDEIDDSNNKKKGKNGLFSFGKKKTKQEKEQKKQKKKKTEYDGDIDEDEDFDWTENVYAKPFIEERRVKDTNEDLENIIIGEAVSKGNAAAKHKNNDIKSTHEAFMPSDIPMPETPPMYGDEIVKKTVPETSSKSSIIEKKKNHPEHAGNNNVLNTEKEPEHDHETNLDQIEQNTEIKERNKHQKKGDLERKIIKGYSLSEKRRNDLIDDGNFEDSCSDFNEQEDDESDGRLSQSFKSGMEALNSVFNFLESRTDKESKAEKKLKPQKKTIKFMGKMTICVMDLYSGCGASYICGSLASTMAGTYGKKTYIVRKQTAATPDNKKIKEVTTKDQMQRVERNAVIIYDCGIYDSQNKGQMDMADNCDVKTLVCSGTEESLSLLARHIHANKELAEDWIYVFNNISNKKQEKKIRELMHAYDTVYVPPHDFSNPPKSVTGQWQKNFRKILSGI